MSHYVYPRRLNDMKNAARLTLILAALVLAVAPLAPAADAPTAVGTWDAVASTPDGDLTSVITIKQVEGALKAEIELGGVQRIVTDEKQEANVFRMKVQYEGGLYDIEAKVDGDAMEGTWQGGGQSGALKAKRRP
jgi:hypothetical protein